MAQTRNANVAGEYFAPGHRITGTAGAAIVGQRFLKIVTGGVGNKPKVTNATVSGEKVCGVSGYDVANGGDVPILHTGAFDVKAGAALTAGQEVQSDATGQAIVLAAGKSAGTCTADTASGGIAPIWLS